ncbi:AsmA family protein [Sphingomonas oryzagri]|uniref:AsmA family protein n=1 Tax=Sphingomonas oryzagri TaxID=3042314 RepID=A0ABT6N283_9SPHN|nr:AsmA family protein [Sphingomonas oryzagri]MDH7639365.1 AsmA family protein [Sphingomonas oryzagri]
MIVSASSLQKRILLAAAAILLSTALALVGLLALADSGAFDRLIMRWASHRLHRPVQMRSLRLDLLSFDPTITIHGIVIGNPAWLHGGHLAEARMIIAHVELLPLFKGKIRPTDLAVSGLSLHLIRVAPGRNNWTMSEHPRPGPAFAPLADVARFLVEPAKIDIQDLGRSLRLTGIFRHDASGARPFALEATGTLKGYGVSLQTSGGQLNAAAVGPPWPFTAKLVDGRMQVTAQGVSAQPFDLSRFNLGMSASGPNLADLGYLFNLATPNSRQFAVRARAQTDGRHFKFSNIVGRVGDTDVAGWIRSDHGSDRKRIVAAFASRQLTRQDIDALLATVPPRALARARSGEIEAAVASPWIFSDVPFGLDRLRANDFDLSVSAHEVQGYSLPLQDVRTHLIGAEGILTIERFTGRLYSGALIANGALDARVAVPKLRLQGRLDGTVLRDFARASSQPAEARLSGRADIEGAGLSLHRILGAASGSIAIQITGAAVPRRAAWILGGDLLRALGNVGGKTQGETIPVSCSAMEMKSEGEGRFGATGLAVSTPLGTALGTGHLDLGTERVSIILQGQPRTSRLMQVATPVKIEGPMQSPTVALLPGRKARALGLKGMFGVALTPIAGLLPIDKEKARLAVVPALACR